MQSSDRKRPPSFEARPYQARSFSVNGSPGAWRVAPPFAAMEDAEVVPSRSYGSSEARIEAPDDPQDLAAVAVVDEAPDDPKDLAAVTVVAGAAGPMNVVAPPPQGLALAAVTVTDEVPDAAMIEKMGSLLTGLPFGKPNYDLKAHGKTLKVLSESVTGNKVEAHALYLAGGSFACVELLKMHAEAAAMARDGPGIHSDPWVYHIDMIGHVSFILANLTKYCPESKMAVAVIGGGEEVVKCMDHFPFMDRLSSHILNNLCDCDVGKRRVVAAGGMKALVQAIQSQPSNRERCWFACSALRKIITNNTENKESLIGLQGIAAVSNVIWKGPDAGPQKENAQELLKLLAAGLPPLGLPLSD